MIELTDLFTLDDFEPAARERVSHMAFEYLASGAADERTLAWNREAFGRILLRPRVLEDVTEIDTAVSLFGDRREHPILLAPVAYQRLFHPEGEPAAAIGAAASGSIYVVSTASNTAIEEIASASSATLWMQVYMQSDREVTRDMLSRAEAAGCKAFCITVDTPVLGTRNRQQRAGFALPPELTTPHLDPPGRARLTVINPHRVALTWQDVDWVRSLTRLPVLVKGIIDPDDAEKAIERGVDGIIVSNHGGRNLDTLPATIDALPFIAERVGGRVALLVDGGIRRGTDIVKALALGASAILIGRPYAWGLAVGGSAGVERVVAILREELETTMALLGRKSIAEVDASVLWSKTKGGLAGPPF